MWQETKHGLYKQFVFKDFAEAFDFMARVAEIAEQMQHHPRWENEWNVVQIWLRTHSASDTITENDRRLAEAIDELRTAKPADKAEVFVDKKATKTTEVKLYADGGSRGNPGPSASGFVLLDMSDKVLTEQGLYLGVTTNNQAEYQALKLGLDTAFSYQARVVHVYMDSMLVVNQMNGVFKVKNRDLWPIHDAIKHLIRKFEKVEFTHVPRELNKLADAEVNKALDSELKH